MFGCPSLKHCAMERDLPEGVDAVVMGMDLRGRLELMEEVSGGQKEEEER